MVVYHFCLNKVSGVVIDMYRKEIVLLNRLLQCSLLARRIKMQREKTMIIRLNSEAHFSNVVFQTDPVDLVILIEGTYNTMPGDFEQVKEIVKSIFYNFDVSPNGTHVAMAVFAEETRIIFNLNKHRDLQGIDDDINAVSYLPGASVLGSALRDIKTNIFDQYARQAVPKVLVTVMTGKPEDEIQRAVNELKTTCVLAFALGLTSNYSPESLNLASGEPHSEYVLISETFPEASLVGKKMADKIKKGK